MFYNATLPSSAVVDQHLFIAVKTDWLAKYFEL